MDSAQGPMPQATFNFKVCWISQKGGKRSARFTLQDTHRPEQFFQAWKSLRYALGDRQDWRSYDSSSPSREGPGYHQNHFAGLYSNQHLPATKGMVQRCHFWVSCSASSGPQAAFRGNLPYCVARVGPTVWALHAFSIADLYKHVGIRGLLAYDIAIDKYMEVHRHIFAADVICLCCEFERWRRASGLLRLAFQF